MDEFKRIVESVSTLPKEYIVTANALGRILAEPVKARTSLPETDIAAVDGYAVRCSDLDGPHTMLVIQGESNSSRPFRGTLQKGSAVKTYAGGKIVEGADAVISFLHADEMDKCITLKTTPVRGENICPAGIDFSLNDESFKAGTVMNSRLVGLAASMHLMWLPVVRRPRVAILAVGSELAMPGEATHANPITASSLYTLPAKVEASGGEAVILGIASDSLDTIKEKIRQAASCDLLITTGGTSPGAGNLMNTVLKEMGDDVHMLKTELKRNDHMIFARYNGMPICALPGNPISSSIYFSLFARPIINKLVGAAEKDKQYAILGRSLDEHDTSVAYLHASLSIDKSGTYKVIPVSAQDGFLLSALAKADCLLVINQSKTIKKGDLVEYIPFSHSLVST